MRQLNQITFIVLLSVLFSVKAYAQYGMQMKLFYPSKVKQTETIVIIDYNDPLNKGLEPVIKKVMSKLWTLSGFEIWSMEEVSRNHLNFKNKDLKNPSYSFIHIVYANSNQGNKPNDRRMILSYGLNEKGKRNTTDPVSAIAQSELNYEIYDLEAGLMKDIALLKAQVEQGYFVSGEDADPSIKEKTLYIPQNIAEKDIESKLKFYPFKYKVVTKEELSKAIKEHQPGVCFVEQTNIEMAMMTVIDVETGKPLFHAMGGEPITGFVQDIKTLKKSIK